MMLAGNVCSRTLRQRGRRCRGHRVGRRARDRHALAGPHQIHHAQPQEQARRWSRFRNTGSPSAPIRPMCLRSPPPAIPATSVPNSSGAMMDRIRRRNTVLISPSCLAKSGREHAQRHARGHADEDPGRQRNSLHRSPHLSFCAQHIEEHHARRADQQQRMVRTVAHHDVMLADRRADLSVDGQVHALVRTARGHADHARLRHQHRTIGQHVRANRRQADAPAPKGK